MTTALNPAVEVTASELASLFNDLEASDPRMKEFGENANELSFMNFAFEAFRHIYTEPTLSDVSSLLDAYLDAEEEGQLTSDRQAYETAGAQEFIELIDAFREKLRASGAQSKNEFVESLRAELAADIAERNAA